MWGEFNIVIIKMIIIWFIWEWEMMFKSWAKGMEYFLILVIVFVCDKGIVFFKCEKEIWNW